jgi:hypothetical protein
MILKFFLMLQSLSREVAIAALRCCMNVLGHVSIIVSRCCMNVLDHVAVYDVLI